MTSMMFMYETAEYKTPADWYYDARPCLLIRRRRGGPSRFILST